MNIKQQFLIVCTLFLGVSQVYADIPAELADPATEQKQIDILKSDAPLYSKFISCRKLKIVGTGKSVETLGSLLLDPQLSEFARFALEDIKDPKAGDALRKALGQSKGLIRIGIISSLGARRDTKASATLAKFALDPKSDAMEVSLKALSKILDRESIDTLLKALSFEESGPRYIAADVAIDAAGRLAAMGRKAEAVSLYSKIGKIEIPEHTRAMALFGEILTRGSKGIPILITQLKGENGALRDAALRATHYITDPDAAEALAMELPGLEPEMQVSLIKTMVEQKNVSAAENIKKLTTSRHEQVAIEAYKALGAIGNASFAPFLIETACSDSKYADVALNSLRVLKGADTDKIIGTAFVKADTDAKALLAGLIEDREIYASVEDLFTAAKSKDAGVRKASLRAIGRLAPASDADRVIALLKGADDAEARKEIEKAAVNVLKKIAGQDIRLSKVASALKAEKDVQIRCSLIRILARACETRAIGILDGLIFDKNEAVADTTIRSIIAINDVKILDELYKIVMGSDSKTHRVLAVRSYLTLVRKDVDTFAVPKINRLSTLMGRIDLVNDKINALDVLASIPHPEALKLALKFIGDEDLKEDAQIACLKLCRAIFAADRALVSDAIAKIAAAPATDEIKREITAVRKQMNVKTEFITSWLISPNYKKDGLGYQELFDTRFAPEMGEESPWQVFPVALDPKKPGFMEFGKVYSDQQCVSYASTWIYSPDNRKGMIEFGSDDGLKVWFNGKIVHANNTGRAAIPASDKVKIDLEKGWNRLMVKVTQNRSGWEFCARLCDEKRALMKDVKIDCLHEDKFEDLFDGKTFKNFDGDLNWFRIQDGAIVAGRLDKKIPHCYYLTTKKQYGDFELRCQIKTSAPSVNAGIQFHSKRAYGSSMIGFQADYGGRGYWGGLYDDGRRNAFLQPLNAEVRKSIRQDGWNNYVVRCEGPRIRIYVNGIQSVDYTEENEKTNWRTGLIGFQIHTGAPAEAWYRNIKIREL